MILGLFLNELDIPVIPLTFMIIGGLVLIAGVAFMIFRFYYEKGESDIDPNTFAQISTIAAWVFIIYGVVELIAACACVCVNDACRYNYHYDITKATCPFCGRFKDSHSAASDALTLGVYFDAFVVNAYITNAIKFVREIIDGKRKLKN